MTGISHCLDAVIVERGSLSWIIDAMIACFLPNGKGMNRAWQF